MLSAVIRRPDRQPLGDAEQVKVNLSDAFPGLKFIFVEESESRRIPVPRFSLARLMLWLGSSRYPHWYGHIQADSFAVEFRLDAKPIVRVVNVTLYGRGTPAAEPHFTKLTANTGWQLQY
jgi:hypothetical protein